MLTSRYWGLCAGVLLTAACGGGSGSAGTENTGGAGTGGDGSASSSGAGASGSSTSSGGTTSTSSSSSSGTTSSSSGACPVFLPTSPWNTDISTAALDPNSATYIQTIGSNHLHPDFGTNPGYGIPVNVVTNAVKKSTVTFDGSPSESDPGPYPIPASPLIEGGGDGHLLMVQTDECVLYEIGQASKQSNGWHGYSGAIWNLKINATRPAGWTSADAAGLPIYPGLVRYQEVAKGAINHAVRFTSSTTRKAYVAPAGHCASSDTSPSQPPMGLRVRLNKLYDISKATPQAKIILTALKKYGMILADNGSSWNFTGAPDPRWNDSDLDYLKSVPGTAFEVVKTGPITVCP